MYTHIHTHKQIEALRGAKTRRKRAKGTGERGDMSDETRGRAFHRRQKLLLLARQTATFRCTSFPWDTVSRMRGYKVKCFCRNRIPRTSDSCSGDEDACVMTIQHTTRVNIRFPAFALSLALAFIIFFYNRLDDTATKARKIRSYLSRDELAARDLLVMTSSS